MNARAPAPRASAQASAQASAERAAIRALGVLADCPVTAPDAHPALAALGPRFWPKVQLDGPADDPRTCWRYVGSRVRSQASADPSALGGAGVRASAAPLAAVTPAFFVSTWRPGDDAALPEGDPTPEVPERGRRPLPAARVAWELVGCGSLDGVRLKNVCGDTACCRPSHHTTYRDRAEGVLAFQIGRDAAAAWYADPARVAAHVALVPDAVAALPAERRARVERARASWDRRQGREASPPAGGDVPAPLLAVASAPPAVLPIPCDPATVLRLFGSPHVVSGPTRRGWIVGCPWGVFEAADERRTLLAALAARPATAAPAPCPTCQQPLAASPPAAARAA